jgi:hypothetical protein
MKYSFCEIKCKITCFLCMLSNKNYVTCEKCKTIICTDCKDTVFVDNTKICFFCLKNQK